MHYGYAEDATSFGKGLNEGAYATSAIGRPMKGSTAYQRLGLTHHSKSPDAYYKIKVDLNVTPLQGPFPAKNAINPKSEFIFPKGTPPGSVTGPFKID